MPPLMLGPQPVMRATLPASLCDVAVISMRWSRVVGCCPALVTSPRAGEADRRKSREQGLHRVETPLAPEPEDVVVFVDGSAGGTRIDGVEIEAALAHSADELAHLPFTMEAAGDDHAVRCRI